MEVGESERPRNSRSRGGCQACKKRKRKCDETRPSCLACQKRGLQCSYYLTLRWDTDAIGSGEQRVSTTAAPGGAAPAATTTTTAATTTPQGGASTSATTANSTTCSAPVPLSAPPAADHQPFEPLRRSSLDIRTVHADAPSSASSSSFSTHIPPTLPPSPADPIEHDLIQEERTRFSKFMEHGIYVLYSTDLQDLLRPLILRLSTESRALRSICVAMQLQRRVAHKLQVHATRDPLRGTASVRRLCKWHQ
uniref:Zn(2)-C6 fungal-type domain-containing protein n=1 Tax=Phialemonium thermophilum TaxID=223376 RepID=A0ABR3W446_9PEZI